MQQPTGWVLWSGTLGLESPVAGRVEAAVAAGFSRLSLSPLDVVRAREQGGSAAALGEQLRAAGLEPVMDPVMNWYGGSPSPLSRFGRFGTDEALAMSEEMGAVSITVVAQPGPGRPVAEVARGFGAVCDRAAAWGAQVHLEFLPMTEVRDVRTAWQVVETADRHNGGLLFDTWHFFRGDPDYEALQQVPGDRVFGVQVDDAYERVRGTMRDDTLHRLLPGQGSFDLYGVLTVLDRMGALTWVGPEVMSPVLEAMPPVEAALLAGGLVRDLVASVRAAAA